MKQCPDCKRVYIDDTLNFCLDDGAALADSVDSSHPTAILTDRTEVMSTPTSAETNYQVSRSKVLFISLAATVVLAIATFAAFRLFDKSRRTDLTPFQQMKLTKLTSNGKATQAVISPDGRQVVYVINDGGRRSLWLRQVATASEVQLAAPEDIDYRSLTISPDGNFLYYVYGVSPGPNQSRSLFQMPVLGGSPRKVIDDINAPIAFSPDGLKIAYVRRVGEQTSIFSANADGTDERVLTTRQSPGTFNAYGNFVFGGLAWSPDGSWVASIAANADPSGQYFSVVAVPSSGGNEMTITKQRWYQIERIAWLSNNSGLVMTGAEQPSDFRSQQVWYLSFPDGDARKITNDLNNYGSISLSSDSSLLVTVQSEASSDIWVAPNGDAARASKISSSVSRTEGMLGVAWTPDGKILYRSMASGSEGIWVMDPDGRNRKQLTTPETLDFGPRASSDGRYIVFVSERTGVRNIWRMNSDGSNPKRITEVSSNNPQVTPDSKWIVFQMRRVLWKVPIEGGEPVQLSHDGVNAPAISPDGRLIACALLMPGVPPRLALIPIDGGEPLRTFDGQITLPGNIDWSPDGRTVTYVSRQNGVCDIWNQPIGGGEAKKLTNFKADNIFYYDWSRNNNLVISYGASASDVVLIRNAK